MTPPYRKFDSSFLEKKTLSSLSILLLEQITGGIYLYSSTEDKILFHNEEFETMTGISARELSKKSLTPYFELLVPEDYVVVMHHAYPFFVDLISRKKSNELTIFKYSLNYRIKSPSGKIRHMFHQSTVLEHKPDSGPDVSLAHISDISEYKTDAAMVLRISAYDATKKKWKKLAEEKFVHTPKILSARETAIMQMLVDGQSQFVIADKLHISYYTVRAHCRHILEKTECRSIKDLRQKSLTEGWT
jgi:DNA-binding CsgD family transcriptional regulator